MMTKTTRGVGLDMLWVGGLAVLAGSSATALGGPPRFDLVDSDAMWAVHIDFEEAHKTDLGEWLLDMIDDEIDGDEFARDLMGELEWGEDIKGLTLYGWNGGGEESLVAVLQGGEALDALEERLWHGHKFLHGDDEFEVAGRSVISLSEPGDDESINIASVKAERGERILIASPNREWLGRALRVAERDRDGLDADAALLEAASPAERAMIVVMATDLGEWDDFEPVSHFARDAGSVWGALSEEDGRVRIRAAVTADDEDQAQQISQVLQGAIAFGQLLAGDMEDGDLKELAHLARGLRFEVDGRTIRAQFEMESEQAARLMDIDY